MGWVFGESNYFLKCFYLKIIKIIFFLFFKIIFKINTKQSKNINLKLKNYETWVATSIKTFNHSLKK
jgi:hypothetical protein